MIDKIWAEIAVDSCVKRSIDHFFVAPGSRCTPLTLAIANNESAQVTQHFDERGLAFAALGYARATGRPGVFVCTSGTAVANAFPAVVEASMDRVPLLLFTADRPDELRGIGANQAIEQRNIFGDYPEVFINLPVPNSSRSENIEERACFLNELETAFSKSTDGPVHVNWMFHEPFTIDDASEEAAAAEQQKPRFPVGDLPERHEVTSADRERQIEIQGNTIIALGNCKPQESREAQRLAKHLNCPLLSDVTSGISACGFELPTEFALPQPDTVLHLGDRITSKSWIAWTQEAASSGTKFVHVTPTGQVVNPAGIELSRLRFPFTELNSRIEAAATSDAFTSKWQEANAKRKAAIESVLAASESLNEPAVAYFVSEHCPPSEGLFIGNSMPIRDMDRYGLAGTVEVRNVAANRGASGIDGLLATATGYTLGLKSRTTVLLGDLSALHDLNSLALIASSPWPMIVLVVNNQGGHIFDMLPISQSKHFEQFFATPHNYRFGGAAETFGIEYQKITNMRDLKESYGAAIKGSRSVVLELVTDRQQNLQTRQAIGKAIQECRDQH